MDSKKIAQRLEKDHPSPSMHLDSPILAEVEKLLTKVQEPLRPVYMPSVPANLLNEPSSEYFHRTRAEKYGKPLAQLYKEDGGEEAWIVTLPQIKDLGQVVQAKGGPFVMGETRERLITWC